MYMVSYRATERGIRLRSGEELPRIVDAAAQERMAHQRALYEAKQAEAARIAELCADAMRRKAEHEQAAKLANVRYRTTFAVLLARACRVFQVTKSEINSARRNRHLVFARQFVMYWAIRLTPLSLPQIGRLS